MFSQLKRSSNNFVQEKRLLSEQGELFSEDRRQIAVARNI